MLRLRGVVDGASQVFPLRGDVVKIGRALDNDVRLVDPSVSRHHAVVERSGEAWSVRDLGSTNGVKVNGTAVLHQQLADGDEVVIGAFLLAVEQEEVGSSSARPTMLAPVVSLPPPPPPPPPQPVPPEPATPVAVGLKVPNATIVRPLKDFSASYGLSVGAAAAADLPAPARDAEAKIETEAGYGNRVFGYLTRLAQLLISAESVPVVLERVVDLVFEALPVERAFILLRDSNEEIVCELARIGDRVEHRPKEGVPVSRTIFEAVTQDRVALLTYDALADGRINAGESIRLHGIRAAISAPLWSGEKIIGVIQVDSPIQAGAFGERDLDFVTALANYAAVAVERLRYAERIEAERRIRARFERYHSPAVIDEMLAETGGGGGVRTLRGTEATVLFADLVGFTAFSEEASPQQVAELLEGYFNQTVEAIFAAGGTLDKFIGDAVMAFFGAPRYQTDHAQRAVAAAIAVRDGVRRWGEERAQAGLPVLQVRVAVNSGPVVVGDVGSERRVDYTVLGNTVNVAARLEAYAAKPGDIVIGPETHRLLAGTVPCDSLGEYQLKGLQQKIEVFRVL